jgi:hypothetical protein
MALERLSPHQVSTLSITEGIRGKTGTAAREHYSEWSRGN